MCVKLSSFENNTNPALILTCSESNCKTRSVVISTDIYDSCWWIIQCIIPISVLVILSWLCIKSPTIFPVTFAQPSVGTPAVRPISAPVHQSMCLPVTRTSQLCPKSKREKDSCVVFKLKRPLISLLWLHIFSQGTLVCQATRHFLFVWGFLNLETAAGASYKKRNNVGLI